MCVCAADWHDSTEPFLVIGFWLSKAFGFTTCAIFFIFILNVIISCVLCILLLLFVLLRV